MVNFRCLSQSYKAFPRRPWRFRKLQRLEQSLQGQSVRACGAQHVAQAAFTRGRLNSDRQWAGVTHKDSPSAQHLPICCQTPS